MKSLPWWQTAVFYQIYPRSFADGNGDGVGDFAGMIAQLDYLRDLGITALWLSPHYPSPQFDCGYDVADYTAVNPEYGTLADFKEFLAGAHQRGIRVILDLVLNHTSDQHPWFLAARADRNSPYRDWYVWRDAVNGQPPNNWESIFGGSAWEWEADTGQYYYHFFFKQQPDLNWRNPAVKQAMFDAMRFWLRLGVDGFRIDAIGTVYEHPSEANHTAEVSFYEMMQLNRQPAAFPEEQAYRNRQMQQLFELQNNQPEMYGLLRELRQVCDEFPDRVLVGEHDFWTFCGPDKLHMVFNFPLMRRESPLTPAWIRANQRERLAGMPRGSWPCNTLNNHDTSRLFTRYGDQANEAALARLACALLLTLKGTPFFYNGEEIGMSDWPVQTAAEFQDRLSNWLYDTETQRFGMSGLEALQNAIGLGRDKCRTPMQWANAPHGGFCPAKVRPWLAVNPNYAAGINVAEQLADPDSLLNFYKRLLAVRAATPALVVGDYTELHAEAAEYLAFVRTTDAQMCLVVLNFSGQSLQLAFDHLRGGQLIFSSTLCTPQPALDVSALTLAPFEVFVCEVF